MATIQLTNGVDSLVLTVHGRTKANAKDYWHANWLHCSADVVFGGSHDSFEWQLRNEDLFRFLCGLERITDCSGEALLETGDGWLDIRVVHNEVGGVEVVCKIEENSAEDRTVEFTLPLQRAQFLALKDQLQAVLEEYPILG